MSDIPIEARIIGGAGMMLRLIWKDGDIRMPVGSERDVTLRCRVPFTAGDDSTYVRAELTSADDSGQKMQAMTNTLFLAHKKP